MRLALFTPYLPLPAVTGGRIRIARLIEGLTPEHEVVLFAAGRPRGLADPEVQQLHREQFAATYLALNRWSAIVPGGRPRRVARCDAPALARAFRRESDRAPFDLALVEHSYAGPIALRSGLPLIVDEHNIESQFHAARAAARGRHLRERDLFQAWERKVWRASAAIACVSKADASVVRAELSPSEPFPQVEVIPNGVACDAIELILPSQRESEEVLFVGLLSHPPNVEAALRLAQEVMPRVWSKRPAARLILCGHAPKPEVRALAGARIEVTGSVPSVAPYLARARVSVNPLRHGAGTSLKVVEALASGGPLVTTGLGVRGYPPEVAAACDLADDDDTMAAALIARLGGAPDDEDARARRRIAERYDWRQLATRYQDLVLKTYRRLRTAAGE